MAARRGAIVGCEANKSAAKGGCGVIKYHPVRLNELIDHYTETSSPHRSPVSVAAATRAILTVMPDCSVERPQLSNMIARSAVRHGHAVRFDLMA